MTPFPKIDLGETPDDGRGDTLRDAFAKVNAGFEYLSAAVSAHLSARFAARRHEHVTYVTREIRQSPPDVAPTLLGALWIDVAAGSIYLATGTERVTDWRRIAFAEPVA